MLEEMWRSRVLSNGGPFHQQFETELARFLGVKYVTLVTNATLGLLVALRQQNLSGEIITTPFSFVATSHAISWLGATPVFADIEPHTLNLDPRQIERHITEKTTGILAVHCYGRPCDVDGIKQVADRHGLRVIYDAAHAFNVRRNNQSLLNCGDLSILSFHATKVFTTFEGGAIVSHDLETKQELDRLCNYGIVDEVTVSDVGINAKMSEFNAALGLLQLKYVDKAIGKRRELDCRYKQLLAGVPGIQCLTDGVHLSEHNFYSFPVLVGPDYPLSRDKLYELLREHGIHARRYFYPLISTFPMYRGLPTAAAHALPIATLASEQVLCLPLFPDLPEREQNRIASIVRNPASAASAVATPKYAVKVQRQTR
jgi:dTDP-4-amino-4,6-dideoxygalactose transaminase